MFLMIMSLWLTLFAGAIVLTLWMPVATQPKPVPILIAGYSHASVGFLAVASLTAYAVTGSKIVEIIALVLLAAAIIAGVATVLMTRRWEHHDTTPPEAAVPVVAMAIHGIIATLAVAAVVWVLIAEL